MNQKTTLETLYDVLINDEDLLRLLHYHPKNYSDDPLSPDKPNVKDVDEDWSIRTNVLKRSKSVSDLTKDNLINRVLIFAGRRKSMNGNYMRSAQRVIVDSLIRIEDDETDFRQLKVNDRINELVFGQEIPSKVTFVDGDQFSSPDGYVGYRLVYEFGSIN